MPDASARHLHPAAASGTLAPILFVLIGVLGLIACQSTHLLEGDAQSSRPSGPSFVLIVTDDQRMDSLADMPSLQEHLFERGTRFQRAFTTTPVCCPSRASILRGQYAHNHGVLLARTAFEGTDAGFVLFHKSGGERSTIATWLDAAGYDTFFAGKYLNGYGGKAARAQQTHVPPGWDQWYGILAPMDYVDYRLNENGTVVEYGAGADDYLTDVMAEKAVQFISAAARRREPFFMYVAPFAPHNRPALREPPLPAPRHARAFADRRARRGPSFNEADVGDKLGWVQRLPLLSDEVIARIDEMHRQRLRSLLSVDEMIGGIYRALSKAGRLDETYLIFVTDNGFRLGEHRIERGKGTAWEEDITVPLAIAGPGVRRGERSELVLLSDIAPTIAHLAGVATPEFVDGRSLVPLLMAGDGGVEWRRAFSMAAWRAQREGPPELRWTGIRTAGHKYVEYSAGGRELYDLAADPFELENLSGRGPAGLESDLAAWSGALAGCAGQRCRDLEAKPPPASEPEPAASR